MQQIAWKHNSADNSINELNITLKLRFTDARLRYFVVKIPNNLNHALFPVFIGMVNGKFPRTNAWIFSLRAKHV